MTNAEPPALKDAFVTLGALKASFVTLGALKDAFSAFGGRDGGRAGVTWTSR